MIRPATPDDAAAIAAIDPAWTASMYADTLRLETTRAFVLEDGDIVGHVLGASVGDTGELTLIAVSPQRRRSGFARQLLQTLTDTWRADGVSEAWLEVRVDNLPAIALYLALGWEAAGIRKRYYRDQTDAQVMRCSLLSL